MIQSSSAQIFQPDYATSPGETLADILASLLMSQTDLARRMGKPVKTINEIIQGKAPVTADTALDLERVLGVAASTWCALEAGYREHLARTKSADKIEVDEAWLSVVPVKPMQERGWLSRPAEKPKLMEEILRFFGVAGKDEWDAEWKEPLVAYRKSSSFEASSAALAAWIRKGEIEGRKQVCKPFDAAKWRQTLTDLRAVSLRPMDEWIPALQAACNDCGVAYVFLAELPNCHVSGATRWLREDCALIMQSGRHKTEGHFWFTFFHEARHVMQRRQKKAWTIDSGDLGEITTDPLERDADDFASEHLVPSRKVVQLRRDNGGKMPVPAVEALAKELGVSTGIVVGHMHHEKYWKPMVGSKLIKRFKVDAIANTISESHA